MEPYYIQIKNVREFLRHYLEIYQNDYNRTRAQKIIRLFPPLNESYKVLDVGCGGGFYSLAACRKGASDITSMDIQPVCVKATKFNLRETTNLDPNGIIADATNLPFRNESFDFVICVDLIEHIKENHALLREIERVLKSNGFMVISTQNSNSLNYLIEAFIQRRILKNHKWMGWDPTHVRFYTPNRLSKLLKKLRFNIIAISGTYFVPYMLVVGLRKINKKISEIIYFILYNLNKRLEEYNKAIGLFGWGIIVLSQKDPELLKNISKKFKSNHAFPI